jgi:hypothetical protein
MIPLYYKRKELEHFLGAKGFTLTNQTLHQRENNKGRKIVSPIERFSDQPMERILAIRKRFSRW